MGGGTPGQHAAGHAPSAAAGLPEGTVTFLFTDIERSTRHGEELGDQAWAELLGTHHRILREAFAAGYEIHTEGDAFFVAFDRAPEALHAAVTAQHALHAHPWPEGRALRVRMGLHTGEALVRDDDYVGHDVVRASRICDAAHGGQILLSDATAALTRDTLPTDTVLTDLGPHRLKDLGHPQHLYTVEAPDLPGDFPPLRTLEAITNNLPTQRSTFIGRAGEIQRIRKLFEGHRLVTLTGVGGAGKTRLALHVGAEELHEHPDGVFFIDLAPVSDPAAVGRTAADAIGLRSEGISRPVEDLLATTLAEQHCLLLLDNCEHLIDACADLADRILAACPRVGILATSREPLGVEGEQVCPVPSLTVPEVGTEDRPSEAVDLFVERAQNANPDFHSSPADTSAVAEICRRLDGIPLAIEFAAARTSHLSAQQIAVRLNDRFRLLTGGRRRVRRQQTLETALDWSHELLDAPQQTLLRRLAVFAGSFSLETAEEVCSGQGVERTQVLDLLGSLVDKSLVNTDTGGNQLRYRLLETVRAYAEGKLHQADEADAYRSAHRDSYLAWLESIPWVQLYLDGDVSWALAYELPNLRAALQWSMTQDRRDLGGRLAARSLPLWVEHGHSAEGRKWLEWALADPEGLTLTQQADCHETLAQTIMIEKGGDPEAAQHAARAIELGYEHLGGRLVGPLVAGAMAAGMRTIATLDTEHARQARSLAQQATEVAAEHGHPWTLLTSWCHGLTMLILGEIAAAEDSFTALIDQDPGTTSPTWVRLTGAHCLAICRILRGDPRQALETAHREIGAAPQRTPWAARSFLAAALAELQLGEPSTAAAHLREALERTQPEIVPLTFNECLIYAGAIAQELNDTPTASRLLAAATHIGAARETAVPFRGPASLALHRHYLPLVEAALDPAEARRHRDEGQAMTPADALATAHRIADTLTT